MTTTNPQRKDTMTTTAPPSYLRLPDRDPHSVLGWVLARSTRRRVVAALAADPEGGTTLVEIGGKASMPVGTINDIIGVLVALGLVVAHRPQGVAASGKAIRYNLNHARVADLTNATGSDITTLDMRAPQQLATRLASAPAILRPGTAS